ncbi:MAG: NAD(P)/FAD-dependent oxidoreductase [Candidatus Microthrix parvicella]|jgi:cation diffusion facilitator CzcD-associated flavoprotein CzcO
MSTASNPTIEPIGSDALRARYRAERDKRLRTDGSNQYLEPTGPFAHFRDDPYSERVERDPVTDEVTVAVIGAGFAGLTTGARLAEAGVTDVRLIEGGGDVGGAWYWNRYPGAMCDTASMVYLPLLEETGHMPSQKYTMGHENFAHAQRIARHFNLHENGLFSTEVTSIDWDEAAARWVIRTDRGDEVRAQFVAMGTGPMHRPKLPGIPGIESFAGHCFHTSRWDYAYTGGGPTGEAMDHLFDKRVGIIGTGATAVQAIPHLARDAGELFVFQRTPSSIDIRNNRPTDPDEFAALEPGWQRCWLENFATLQTGGFTDEDLVMDGWTDIAKRIRDRVIVEMTTTGEAFTPELVARAYEDSDDEKMNEIRARVDEIVTDETTAEALKPWYRQLCKRPCFHDEYLDAYNRLNTHLIDTDGKGVEAIDATGVWAAGNHYPLDCLVFASGFDVHLAHSATYETTGRGGRTLSEHWADGMRSLHGNHVAGFPNLFIVGLNQGANLISNVTHNLTEAATAIAAVVAHALAVGATEVEVTAEAEEAWVAQFEGSTRGFLGNLDCTPGYYNNEGADPTPAQRLNACGYPDGPVAYFQLLDAWRTSGDFDGLTFNVQPKVAPGPKSTG